MALELIDIQKSYGNVHAVQGVNLTIPEGEFFALLGPSGCGKTTLLRMLGGFETPTSGEIRHQGRRIDDRPAHVRPFNMVFQRYALFPHLSVWENVAFGPKMHQVKGAELKARVEEALALVRLSGYESRAISTLSGGQQQRVALARALVNRPKVLLLDEPLSALDLKLRQQMQVELRALQRRLGHSFIFVTHDQEEALSLADRIAVMNGGKIEQVGRAEEVYETPRTPFVARFIGSVNAIRGTIATREGATFEIKGPFKRPIQVRGTLEGSDALSAGSEIEVLIRPEKLRLLKAAPKEGVNSIEGVIRETIYHGPITRFYVQPREWNGPDLQIDQPNLALSVRKNLNAGDEVHVAWEPEDSFLMGVGAAGGATP